MKWQSLITEEFRLMSAELEKVLNGLTTGDLHQRPSPRRQPHRLALLAYHSQL